MVATPAIEPSSPEWFQRWAQRLSVLLNAPTMAPTRLWSTPTTGLPPASKWQGCMAYDTTLGSPVYSDGSAWNAL